MSIRNDAKKIKIKIRVYALWSTMDGFRAGFLLGRGGGSTGDTGDVVSVSFVGDKVVSRVSGASMSSGVTGLFVESERGGPRVHADLEDDMVAEEGFVAVVTVVAVASIIGHSARGRKS